MPYVVIEANGHDFHTDQKAYVTNDPPKPEHNADFDRWVVFVEDEVAAHEYAAQRTISCTDGTPLAEATTASAWREWLEEIDFGD